MEDMLYFQRLSRSNASPKRFAVDELEAIVEGETRRRADGRSWVMLNMISSLDGAVVIDGLSGPLGGPADKAMFMALRAVADVVLVGAGTARTEGYGPPSSGAPLALVTRSARLDPRDPMFSTLDQRAIVYVAATAPDDRVDALREVADVVVAGEDSVEIDRAIDDLGERGHRVVLAEGGPRLNGDLLTTGRLDELCLSIAPMLVGGTSPRIMDSVTTAVQSLRLDRVFEADGLLLTRYLA